MKSGMLVSFNCSLVLRTQQQRLRRMPSVQGAMRLAWYAIFIMAADVFVEPTGPTTSDTKASLTKKSKSELGGV